MTFPFAWGRPSYLLRLAGPLHEESITRYRPVCGISRPSTNSDASFVASNMPLSSCPYVGKFNWAILQYFRFIRTFLRLTA